MPNSANSMSQNFGQQHQQLGSFNFTPNGFQRSELMAHQQQQEQQIPRDKLLRFQGFAQPLAAALGEEDPLPLPSAVYETNGMLSEMFNFPPAAAEFSENHSSNFRNSAPQRPANELWYGSRQGMVVDRGGGGGSDLHQHNHHQMSRINVDSEAAMQLFAMNPQPRSPSPPPAVAMNSSSTLHMFPQAAQFQWLDSGNTSDHRGGARGQGLSLSLSSSLQGRLEGGKADELRIGDVGSNMLFFNTSSSHNHNHGAGAATSAATSPNSVGGAQSHHHHSQHHHHHLYYDTFGYNPHEINQHHHHPSMGLRNSKYAKATHELLEEFCSVGKGHGGFKHENPKFGHPSTWKSGDSSSSSKDPPPLSPSDRAEHQRRKVKLLSMLDEVDKRYNHYCEQMRTVVNSFDVAMGFGAAVPYTVLAQKAMSRHFRCLKDAIAAQLRRSCELLGDKDGGGSGASGSCTGITKGETPRLRILEQSLRQQRAFHHMGMGMMEQEAWRPQRGLPERSVNILRAWLFEHFLHPYPSDADKLLLARQTGLSRNQVSNWFINARVRLWKPMVEEMYQQESKDKDDDQNDAVAAEDTEMKPNQSQSQSRNSPVSGHAAQTPTTIPTTIATGKRPETNAHAGPDSDTSPLAINRQRSFSENQATQQQPAAVTQNFATLSPPPPSAAVICGGEVFPGPSDMPESQGFAVITTVGSELQRHYNHRAGGVEDACRRGSMVATATYGTTSAGGAADVPGSAHLIRFGTTAGDVSLTLGLRHAGNQPEKSHFSVGDFGRC